VANDPQRKGEALDLEDDWADVRPAPDPEQVLRWALEVEPVEMPNPCVEVPLDGIDTLAEHLGVDREVLSQPDAPRTGERTLSAWFRSAAPGRHHVMSLTGDEGYNLYLDDGHLGFQARGSRDTTSQTFNDGEWHQVVVVNREPINHIYVDGRLVSYDTVEDPGGALSPWNGASTMEFAAQPVEPSEASFNEVAMWDRTLTPAEVEAIYNGGEAPDLMGDEGLSEGLTGLWRLSDDSVSLDGTFTGEPDDLEPTPFDDPSLDTPFTNRPMSGFKTTPSKATHDCSTDLTDGEMCPICGRVYWTPPSRYELLMKDD